MNKYSFDRRTMLKGVGTAGLASLFPWLRPSRVQAQSMTPPKRLLILYRDGFGSMRNEWKPIATAGQPMPTQTSWDFDPNGVNAPLSMYKNNINVIDGIDMISADVDPTEPYNAHVNGTTHVLTAANRLDQMNPGAISIDQVIAQNIGMMSQLPSYSLQVSEWAGDVSLGCLTQFPWNLWGNGASATGPGALVQNYWDPPSAYAVLFPNGNTGQSAQTQQAALLRRQAILNFASGEFSALSSQLSSADQMRAQQHMQLISDLETRIGMVSNATMVPDPTTFFQPWTACDLDYDVSPANNAAMYTADWQLNSQLAVLALANQLTNVVVMSTNWPSDNLVPYTPGEYSSTDIHDLQHKVGSTTPDAMYMPGTDAYNTIKAMHLYSTNQLASVIAQLQSITEADGSTLFDNTLVVRCSQLAYGDHDLHDLDWLVASGNANNRFFSNGMGRYMLYPRTPSQSEYPEGSVGLPHNQFWVSVANAMGVPITSFGNPSLATGPLPGL